MNDLRYDPSAPKPKPAEAFAALRAKFGAQFDAMDPDQLRTVPMPDLRSGECRDLDATARELPPLTYAQRTDAKMDALWLALQELRGTVDSLRCEQARTIAELTAYIRDHSEGEE